MPSASPHSSRRAMSLEVPVIPPPLPTTPIPSHDGAPTPSPHVSSAAAFVAASAAAEASAPDLVFDDEELSDVKACEVAPLVRAESFSEDGEPSSVTRDADPDETGGAGTSEEVVAVVMGDDVVYAVPLRKSQRKGKMAAAETEAEAPRAAIAVPMEETKRTSRMDRLGAAFSRLLDRDKDDREKSQKQQQRRSSKPTISVGQHSDGENEKQSGERSSLMSRGSNFFRRSFRAKSTAESDSADETWPPLSPRSPLAPVTSLPSLPSEGSEPEEIMSVSVAGSRASVYAEELVSSLACSACSRYMQAPIEQCRRGHNVCRHCRARASRFHFRCPAPGCSARLAGLRNRLAEEVAAKLLFPCAHAHVGCTRQVPSDELEFHEPRCSFRVYKCLINVSSGVLCTWQGRRVEMEEHVRKKHFSYFSEQVTTKWRWGPNLIVAMQDYQLITAHGEIFWYCAAQDPRRMRVCWFVCLVGPDTRALRYSFVYRLTAGDGRIIEITCPTLPDYTTTDAIIDSGKCADLSYAQILSMMDDDGLLNFSVTITANDT